MEGGSKRWKKRLKRKGLDVMGGGSFHGAGGEGASVRAHLSLGLPESLAPAIRFRQLLLPAVSAAAVQAPAGTGDPVGRLEPPLSTNYRGWPGVLAAGRGQPLVQPNGM